LAIGQSEINHQLTNVTIKQLEINNKINKFNSFQYIQIRE